MGNTDSTWGLDFELRYDLAVGYTAELLTFSESNDTFLALNPILYLQAFTEFRVKLSLPMVKTEAILDFKPIRLSPLDY